MVMSFSPEHSFSALPADSSSVMAMSSSTPPTTVADNESIRSDGLKPDDAPTSDPLTTTDATLLDHEQPDSPTRIRRSRGGAPVYNLAKLSGTDGHGRRSANGDVVSERNRIRRRRTVARAHEMLQEQIQHDVEQHREMEKAQTDAQGTLAALDLRVSPPQVRKTAPAPKPKAVKSPRPATRFQPKSTPKSQRLSSRSSLGNNATVSPKLDSVGKRTRRPTEKVGPRVPRELRRLQDTKEFAGIEDKPVVYSVWANGKEIFPDTPQPPARKKAKVEAEPQAEQDPEPVTNTFRKRAKKYVDRGLYAGQDNPLSLSKGLTPGEKKKLTTLPELIPSGRVNKTLPSPVFHGLRTLITGRDFKLPYQICNPLPPGQPKPDEWKKMTKNRFIGDSKEYWRKLPHFDDYQSKCVCKPDDGCAESCQNRIMFYECDDTNCNVGKKFCANRAFADLTTRRNKGGKYRVGVEVIKTSDRGYGVRSNRSFEPNQIIMEYAGEIITAAECERRMEEVYKDNECYYLMSFDQNMIIDATTGSIARFVNHSCNPNCHMTKWIVSGQPRMALFAGDKPISTGEELTYDYNFDPFSAKHVQKCLCGSENCRGVLGPKPREIKLPKTDISGVVKGAVKAGKRKLQELIGGKDSGKGPAKKRKIQPATGVKGQLSKKGAKMATNAAAALKKGMSTITKSTKAALGTSTSANRNARTAAVLKKTTTNRVVKAYGKGPNKITKQITTSRKINASSGKAIVRQTTIVRKSGRVTRSPRKALEMYDIETMAEE